MAEALEGLLATTTSSTFRKPAAALAFPNHGPERLALDAAR